MVVQQTLSIQAAVAVEPVRMVLILLTLVAMVEMV
jgi:hypothetical protein